MLSFPLEALEFMSAKTQAVDRLFEVLAPVLGSEVDRLIQEAQDALRQELEKDFQNRLQTAIRETEAAANSAAQIELEHAAEERIRAVDDAKRAGEEAKENAKRQVTAELAQRFNDKLQATTNQLKNEAAEERARLETALTQKLNQQKGEWSAELTKVEDELEQWRAFAKAQPELADSASQPEILSRFLKLAEPFAEGLALYVVKADGLALWKSKGKKAFSEIISKETTDPESYFRTIAVRGKTVGAICATPSFKADALDFLAGSLERAIEIFGLKLKTPVPKPAPETT